MGEDGTCTGTEQSHRQVLGRRRSVAPFGRVKDELLLCCMCALNNCLVEVSMIPREWDAMRPRCVDSVMVA